VDGANIILLGGVDGSLFHVEQQKHPGFTRAVLSYDAKADKWLKLAAMPAGSSRVTVPTAFWRGSWVIVSGEARPGVRSPKVFSITLGGAR